MEILAPAGSLPILIVAIKSGCDAVYISGKKYGARKFAENFTNEELETAVNYAHLRKVKVYVTINTLMLDCDFLEIKTYLSFLQQIKVDAVIVQDLGLIHFIRLYFPSLVVHASTQLSINSASGAQKLKQIGVKRVVVARETPIEIIKEIVETGIEVEVFIHGALCFAISGQCLLSYEIGKRSGNKGECAQPCRKKYRLIENKIPLTNYKSLFSMKDLNTIDYLDELKKVKVTSLKIEGRMKSAEYVKTVVQSYHQKLYGNDVDNNKLKVVFNREFTRGYMFKEENKLLTTYDHVNHQGLLIGKIAKIDKNGIFIKANTSLTKKDAIRIVGKNEIGFYISKIELIDDLFFLQGKFNCSIGDNVYKTSDYHITEEVAALHHHEKFKYEINFKLIAVYQQPLKLICTFQNQQIIVEKDVLDEIAKQSLSIERIKEQLKKSGNSFFQIISCNVIYDELCFLSIKDINEIRRMAIEKITQKILEDYKIEDNIPYCFSRFLDLKIINKKGINFYFVANTKEQQNWCDENQYHRLNYNQHLSLGNCLSGLIHNFSDIEKGRYLSPCFNITNSYAISFLSNYHPEVMFLSAELEENELCKLILKNYNNNLGVMIYGRKELMSTRHCIINKVKQKTHLNCGQCQLHEYMIQDEYQNLMPLFGNCSNYHPENIIYSYKLTNQFAQILKYTKIGIKHFLIVLTSEKKNELKTLKEQIEKFKNLLSK